MAGAWMAGAAFLVAAIGTVLQAGTAGAADLDRGVLDQRPRWRPLEAVPIDPTPPASTSGGYYGYYGVDIGGTPYRGLYSEPSVCIRSVRTPEGWRDVDACR